jgi:hypothetical protein
MSAGQRSATNRLDRQCGRAARQSCAVTSALRQAQDDRKVRGAPRLAGRLGKKGGSRAAVTSDEFGRLSAARLAGRPARTPFAAHGRNRARFAAKGPLGSDRRRTNEKLKVGSAVIANLSTALLATAFGRCFLIGLDGWATVWIVFGGTGIAMAIQLMSFLEPEAADG